MDTRSNGIDNKTEATTNKSEETAKQLTQETKEEIYSPPPAGSISYKLRAKWIRMLAFILSAFLVAYGVTAVMALSCIEYEWDIEAAVMGDEQVSETFAENTEQRVYIHDIDDLYGALCSISSQVLRYDNDDFEYLEAVSSELRQVTENIYLDEGYGLSRIVCDDRFEYYAAYGDRCCTNIYGLSAGSGYDEIAKELGQDDAFYIRLGDKSYTGGKNKDRVGRIDENDITFKPTDPDLTHGSAYYDEEFGAHVFNYFSYSRYSTVYDDAWGVMEKLENTDSAENDDEIHLPVYKGGVRYMYSKKLDDYAPDKTLTKLDDSGIKVAIGLKPYKGKAAATLSKDEQMSLSKGLVISLLPVAAVLFVIVIMLMVRCGYDRDTGHFTASKWLDKKFSLEFFIFAACAALICEGTMLSSLEGEVSVAFDRKNFVFFGSVALSTLLLWIIGFGSILVILRKLKTGNFIKTSVILSAMKAIAKKLGLAVNASGKKLGYDKLNVAKKARVRNIVLAVVTVITLIWTIELAAYNTGDELLLILPILAAYAVYLLWYLSTSSNYYGDAARLCDKLDTIVSDQPYNGDDVKEGSPFYPSYNSLDTLDDRVRKAAEEMVKSERTKVELVTNVSHDLKTPLTSIISYTYLLSKEEMSDEAKDYVMILQQKSEKLKSIVNDVFTLAKAASGAEVKSERLDLAMLVNQTVASNQDIIERSGLTVKTVIPDKPVYIMGDGDKLSRVFQNLLDNALKYSLKGTRVFIEMTADGRAEVAFKNTSAEEMTFTADEITERFTRGDKSRTDGGSGLGLSIAKTFTEACGGDFRIELEGDMFRAIASFDIIE